MTALQLPSRAVASAVRSVWRGAVTSRLVVLLATAVVASAAGALAPVRTGSGVLVLNAIYGLLLRR